MFRFHIRTYAITMTTYCMNIKIINSFFLHDFYNFMTMFFRILFII